MSVLLVCPYCSFSKKLSEKKIPAAAKMAVCPHCHQKFPLSRGEKSGVGPREKPPEMLESDTLKSPPDSDAETDGIPWEKRDDLGLLNGIFLTLKKALFEPGVLFRSRNYPDGFNEPLAFGLLVGGLGDMLAFFWPVILFSFGILPFGDSVFRHLTGIWLFLTLMVRIPLAVILNMFFYSGILHLMLRMVRGGKGGYQSTFRVVAYSQAALAWNIIPFVGSWIATVWKLVIQVIGLHEIHHISYTRVMVAFLLPVFIFFALIIIAMGLLLMLLF
ncbi:MAG: YIP1 family protein [Deltaproteobacteria bacterium]|nr:YIP1 family protein [Deltaproteobacteria bacterium]